MRFQRKLDHNLSLIQPVLQRQLSHPPIYTEKTCLMDYFLPDSFGAELKLWLCILFTTGFVLKYIANGSLQWVLLMKIKILFLPWGSSTFYWPGDLREQSYCARYWRYLELFGALLRRNLMRSLGKTVFKHLSCCNQWTFLVEIEESDQDFKMFDLADLWFIRVHSYIQMPIWTDHFSKKGASLI